MMELINVIFSSLILFDHWLLKSEQKNSKEKVDRLYLARVITNLYNSHI